MATASGSTIARNVSCSLRDNLSKLEIPSLNGLRGVAALVVVVWHYLDTWHLGYLFPGPFAVTLFFELSGLLITWLLLNELEATGTIQRARFYARRSLRLFPVFYAVWALCRLAGPFPGSWAYLFYLGDYYTAITHKYSILTQAWSLGVEEKFYLLWPLALSLFRRPVVLAGAVVLLVAEPLYRLALAAAGFETYTWFAFDTRLDAILLGCVIALLVRQGWRPPEWLNDPLTPGCALILVLVFQQLSGLVTYLLAILMVSVVSRPPALLNNPWVKFLGSLSYSLYLVHPYVQGVLWPRIYASKLANWIPGDLLLVILTFEVALAICAAIVLHFAVERPFLLLKERYKSKQPRHAF